MSSIDRVRNAARTLGLQIDIVRMDQSTRTAQEAADACGCSVAQIVKSLVFENADTGALILLLVAGNNNADLDLIRETHGLTLQRCDTRKVRNETGFAIGGVAPIGHINPIRVLMDEGLLAHPAVWAAAGRPDSVFSVEPNALCAAISAETISVANP
nr:YbaK/EbsC family protein [Hoeflea prorocentri]